MASQIGAVSRGDGNMKSSPVTIINPDDLDDDVWDRIMADDATPRPASLPIGYHITDADGVIWEVWDARTTTHDFAIYLGRATPVSGPGGATVILTPDLISYLERHRRSPDLINLPISKTTIKRLRRALGHNWYEDGEKWWLQRMDDLEKLTTADFAIRYGVKAEAVVYARLNLLGTRQRPAGWWTDPATANLILSPQPRLYVAMMLDISASVVGKYRTRLRKERGELMDDASIRKRIGQAKCGRKAHPNTAAALLAAAKEPKSAEWCEALSERNRNRPRPAAWVEREWTSDEEQNLGMDRDRAVAEKLGRTIHAVRARRQLLGIPAYAPEAKKAECE